MTCSILSIAPFTVSHKGVVAVNTIISFSVLMISIISLIGTSNTHAATSEECAKKANTLDIVDCHTSRYSAADKSLNVIYGAAMKALTEKQKTKLRESQRAWLKFRDSSFEFVIEMNSDSGSFAGVAISNYKATFVELRVRELNDKLTGPGGRPDWLPKLAK